MLNIDVRVNSRAVSNIRIVRREPHEQIKGSFWYSYKANYDDMAKELHTYEGRIVHAYRRGAFVLLELVVRDIRRQQKVNNVPMAELRKVQP